MKTIKQFFNHPETFVGIASAFAFILIFFCVWMTAYDGVTDRTDNLTIGLVNQDDQTGQMIEKELVSQVPFEVKTYLSIDPAKKDMDERNLDMVMVIPNDFSVKLQGSENAEILYYINQANASLAKQIMDGAAKEITQSVNGTVYSMKQQVMLSQLPSQLSTSVPSEEIAAQISNSISQALQSLKSQPVQASIEKTNNTDGFAATMIPLMMVLASFVGSMIMSMNVNGAALKVKAKADKWSILLARQIINLGAAIVLSLITLLFLKIFHVELKTTLIETGVFQFLVYFSFLSFTQMFVILFGPGGMLFNILALSLQLVTSGAIVPTAMLSDFYQNVSFYLPATYAADGYYTIIFGGESLGVDMIPLLVISVVTLFVAVLRVSLQKKKLVAANMKVAGQ